MEQKNMTTVRVAKNDDKHNFKNLWKICFGDSDPFCDWFFEHRFQPDYSVVLETEGETVSCMQAFPYTVRIRGKEIPGAMLCGVSTHPKHRGKGYMGKIFSYEMNHLRMLGAAVAPHTPAVLPSYFSFGHFPVADAAYLRCKSVPELMINKTHYFDPKDDISVLFPLYRKFSEKYSGIIQRTEEDFLRKAADYGADGGKVVAYTEEDVIKAYAFYYLTETELLCVEAVAEDGYWNKLLEGLFSLAAGLKISIKLPPDAAVNFPFSAAETITKGVMGVCNISLLLKTLDLSIPYGCSISDHIVTENNGTFDFKGNPYRENPVFEISAGHFLQVLVGYHTLEELKNEIKVFDADKFSEINGYLQKLNCYIIDEY